MNKQIIVKQKEYTIQKQLLEKESMKLSRIRLELFIIIILLITMYFELNIKLTSIILGILFMITFIIIIIKHEQIDNKIKKINNYLKIIDSYFERVDGTYISFKDDGSNLIEEQDIIEDFNIVGKKSLFQLLNVSKSKGGKKRFLKSLTNPSLKEKDILENQKAITELKDNFNYSLIIQEELSCIEEIDDTDFKDYFQDLDKPVNSKKITNIIAIILSIISDIILILCIINIIPFVVFLIPLLIQTIISYIYNFIHNEELERITTLTRKISKLEKVYPKIIDNKFNSKKLADITFKIKNGNDSIKKLSKINELNNLRDNFLTYIIFNTICSLNILVIYKYSNLIFFDKEKIKTSIEALEELESLLSLSTICMIKSKTALPSIEKEISLNFKDLKHPFLKEDKCIPNSFSCKEDINIITGSNMSGKTSFLRTIGINLILMYAGTYVNGESFSASIMQIFSSIHIRDDINNNISSFYAELLRIKKIIDYSNKNKLPLIIFIDEIFKGTNYNDRIYGAKEVIRKLSKIDCITFITTHDFELCEIEDKKINNYHFEEEYQNTEITFDYKLKKDRCTKTNAKYLMKKLGIINEKN